MLESTFHSRIEEIPNWDEIARPAGFYSEARWLRSFEDIFRPTYLAIRDGRDVLAIAACYVASRAGGLPEPSEPPRVLALPAGHAASDLFPFLHVGAPRGYSNRLLVSPAVATPQDRGRVLGALLATVEKLTADCGARLYGFTFLPVNEALELKALAASLELAFAGCEFVMKPVLSYSEYLQQSRLRQREQRNFASMGLRTTVQRLGEMTDETIALSLANQRKYYGELGADQERRFDREVREWVNAFDADTNVVCAWDGNRCVGFCCFIRAGDALYARFAGTAPDAPKRASVFFNVEFYEAVRLAEREGISRIHYGVGAAASKVSRGCGAQTLASVFGPPGTLPIAEVHTGGLARLASVKHDLGPSVELVFPQIARDVEPILGRVE